MKWKYKTIKLNTMKWFLGSELDEEKLDHYMNELGEEGWELVAAFATNVGAGQTANVVVIFKRLKE
jgi:hypothetical protein